MKHLITGDDLLLVLEALSNSYRLQIISILSEEKKFVSQLARELGISRPLLYLHLKKLEEAEIVSSYTAVLDSGKSAKYFVLNSFNFELDEKKIQLLSNTLTPKK